MRPEFWWYLSRSTGIVAYALVSLAVIVGLALSTRLSNGRPKPAWLLDMHRMLGGLALMFTFFHLAALVADSFEHFGAIEILVPLASDWHPVAVAAGVCAFYLLVAVEVTSLLKRRLSIRTWRSVHMSSYALFWLTAVHGATSGTDATHPAYRITSVALIGAVLTLTLVRVLMPGQKRTPRRPKPAAATSQAPDT